MSTDYKEYPEHKLVEIVVDGKVTQADFDRIAGQLDGFIESHGQIRLLEEIRKFKGFDPTMLWDGIKFDVKHMKNFSHCAVVSDLGWLGPFSKFAGMFIKCKVRVFPSAKIDEARQWLRGTG